MSIKPATMVNTVALGGLCLFGQAMAACTGPALSQAALSTALTSNTVCAIRGADRWQELHQPGGDLIDYKRGPTDKVDPSEKVGTWSVASNGQLTYNYGSGGSYRFSVRANGGTSYSFCGIGTADIDVVVKLGGGACP